MASGRSLVQEVEFRLEQSFRREEDDRRRKEELDSFGAKMVEEATRTRTGLLGTLVLLARNAAHSDADKDLLARIERLAEPAPAFLGPERGEEQK